MNVNDPLLLADLRRDEAVRYVPYRDSKRILTVGVGHNLEAHPLDLTYPLTDAQVNAILAEDLIDVIEGLDKHMPWWDDLTQARQRVMANMAFNLGIPRLLGFRKMLAAIQCAHYEQAAAEMMDSAWAVQVGDRAKRLKQMMVSG